MIKQAWIIILGCATHSHLQRKINTSRISHQICFNRSWIILWWLSTGFWGVLGLLWFLTLLSLVRQRDSWVCFRKEGRKERGVVEVIRACYVRAEELLISGLVYFSLVKDKKIYIYRGREDRELSLGFDNDGWWRRWENIK